MHPHWVVPLAHRMVCSCSCIWVGPLLFRLLQLLVLSTLLQVLVVAALLQPLLRSSRSSACYPWCSCRHLGLLLLHCWGMLARCSGCRVGVSQKPVDQLVLLLLLVLLVLVQLVWGSM